MREFGEAVDRLAGGMLAAGLRKGDRVGVWSPNRAEWALTQYATAKAGRDPRQHQPRLPRSTSSSTRSCSRAAAGSSPPSASRTPTSSRWSTHVRPQLPELERAIFFDTPDWEELASGAGYTGDLDAHGDELDFDDPINIQYTSGTTGFPKGATLTHHNILNNGYFVGAMLGYTERDRVCIPVPLYHCFGMVLGNLAATSHGACMVYPAETFDPLATLEACAQERCTSLYGVPTMFIAELAHERFCGVRLRPAAHRHHGRVSRARSR